MARHGNRKTSGSGKGWKINQQINSNESDGSDNDEHHDVSLNSENSNESLENDEANSGDQQPPVRTRGPNKGADVPANEIDRPTIIAIGNKFSNTQVTSDITMIIKSNYNDLWPTWKKVPQDIRDLFWKQFKMHYKWPAWRNTEIYNAWKKTNSDRFRNIMADERRRAQEKYGENKKAWKTYKSEWINSRLWKRLIDEVWTTDEWEVRSSSGKKNRLMGNETAEPTYTGGSIPIVAHEQKMTEELERKPIEVELFDRTHKLDKGKGEYVCTKAKKVRENYEKGIDEKFPDVEIRPSFDPIVWSEASGGASKQRVYGFGSSRCGYNILGNDHEELTTCGRIISDRDEFDQRLVEYEKMLQDMQKKNAESMNDLKESMMKLQSSIPGMMKEAIIEYDNIDDSSSYAESDGDILDHDMGMHRSNRTYASRDGKASKKNKGDDKDERRHQKQGKKVQKKRKIK